MQQKRDMMPFYPSFFKSLITHTRARFAYSVCVVRVVPDVVCGLNQRVSSYCFQLYTDSFGLLSGFHKVTNFSNISYFPLATHKKN